MQALVPPLRRIQLDGKRLALLSVLLWALVSCVSQPDRQADQPLHPGWPKGHKYWQEAELPAIKVAYPKIPDAEPVGDNELCMTCHEGFASHFQQANIHGKLKCEDCHGPASRHLITRGQEPGLIFSFKKLEPAQRSEICLKCHEQDACGADRPWRTSVHAHRGVTCTDCHTAHYEVPPGTPPVATEGETASRDAAPLKLTGGSDSTATSPAILAPIVPQTGSPSLRPNASTDRLPSGRAAGDATVVRFQEPEQSDDSASQAASLRAASNHLRAVAPQVCYRCHEDKTQLEEIAGPHQIGGPNGFNCTTCHDPHGNILEGTRRDLCLSCHRGSPTAAWHSSIHSLEGVACTDCHNPHPDTYPQRVVDIRHTNLRRLKRLPMSVQEPETCYKCHPKIFGRGSLPSHHPIQEGKVVCSDCHDPHGQSQGNLRDVTVNLVCWRCHAETQGPFAYEHPPVTENCLICHEPHGTVQNNLLRQPTTFLCLRCHSGHRTGPGFHDSGLLPDIGTNPALQRAFFSDCTQCHSQIHGSDVPSPRDPGVFVR